VLEADVGARLFDRHPDGYLLSQKGATLLPLVEEMARSSEAIERSRLQLEESIAGPVRLSTDPWNCRFISRHLGELLSNLPGVELELVTAYSFVNLSRREADLAIRNQRPAEGRLASRGLPDADYAVFGARHYVERLPADFTETQYANCRWVGYDDTLDHLASARWLAQKIGRPAHLRYNGAGHFLDAVLGGAGLAILPCFLALDEPDLVRLSPVIPEIRQENQWLVVHQDMRDAPRVRLVADKIANLYQRHRHILQPIFADG
jgi:DNA-binding transcriptional LysR family regulator